MSNQNGTKFTMKATSTQQRQHSYGEENCLNHSQDRSKQTSKLRKNLYGFCTLDKSQCTYLDPILGTFIGQGSKGKSQYKILSESKAFMEL